MNLRFFLSLVLCGEVLFGSFADNAFAAATNALLDVRVGTHKQFDRVVFELQTETAPVVKSAGDQKLEVRFSGLNVPSNFGLPTLPPNLTIVKRIDAYRDGESDVVFMITLSRDATPSELPLAGSPFRLALDLAPRLTESPAHKPEYIPGDLPIPTKLAEADAVKDTTDPMQALAVLAYYYLARGDTPSAQKQAGLYEQATGNALDIPQPSQQVQPAPKAPAPAPKPKATHRFWPKKLPRFGIPTMVTWLIVFGGGLLGGLILSKVFGGILPPRIRVRKKARPEQPPKALDDELEEDLQALDEAVAQEPPRKVTPPPPPKPELEPEPVMEEERDMRESLMDRRVRRVLELSREGRSVTDIAEELQMGQDEVKLILDLNQ